MNWQHVWIVFSTEFTNTLRDRRTWLAMVVIPLLMVPVLLVAAPTALEGQLRSLEETPPRVALVGGSEAPDLVAFLRQSPQIEWVEVASPLSALADGDVKAILRIEPGAGERIAGEQTALVIIEYDASSQTSEITRARIQEVVSIYAQGVVSRRLEARGIHTDLLVPIQTEVRNVASEERLGGFFLAMVMPMMLAVWAALGGMYAAIDAVAGEKERGTLEPLLATPPSRSALVVGKYFTVVLTSVIASVIALAGIYVAYLIKPEALTYGEVGVRFSMPLVNVLLVIATSVLLAAFFGAVQLVLSALARSFREAQSYISPMSIVVVIPGIFTQFLHPAEVSVGYYLVPVMNAIFLFKQALMNAIDWSQALVALVSSLGLVVLALRFAVRVFQKESVLFRS